ncbi:MAG: hypothetical protein ABIS50_21610 [Luteolibacter sp.]|uniref:hypothetical protein n=1 Tax=Luteolibacter sp. TaxID=1962973 RepID=UPI0032662515
MLRYLKAAFLVRERVPLLGAVPVNVLATTGFLALGFGHPAFWLLGILGETAYLWTMTSSGRFRKVVDALECEATAAVSENQLISTVGRLNRENLARREALHGQLGEIERAYTEFAPNDPTARENLDSLRQLESAFVKLLAAHQHITETNDRTDGTEIEEDFRQLETDLRTDSLSSTARTSKQATLELLWKRLEASQRRTETLADIDSDLDRIEAQFSLAVESAAIRAKPEELHVDVDITSRMITTTEIVDRRLLQ